MTRRPLLAAAALCATLTLAACNGSPKAGQPNTAPTSTPVTTPTTSSTPGWTAEEIEAIKAAQSRYGSARAAVGAALADPTKASHTALERAGNGGKWLTGAIDEISQQRDRGWYQSGLVKIVSTSASSVRLEIEQPEVMLSSCIDSSAAVLRYRATNKPVPLGPNNGKRHRVQAMMALAPSEGSNKAWFLVEEKVTGAC